MVEKDNKFVVGDIEEPLCRERQALSDVQIKAYGKTIDVSEGKAQINVDSDKLTLPSKR